MMFLCSLAVLIIILGNGSAQSINPLEDKMQVHADQSVTLSCEYTSSGSAYLHWYQQYPGSRPEYLLTVYPGQEAAKQGRFKSTANKTAVNLEISSTAVSDSALYYCALRPQNQNKIIFAKGTRLTVLSKQETKPQYYKVGPQGDKEKYCLATGFTQQNATDKVFQGKPEAVRFNEREYYSRLAGETTNCTEDGEQCNDADLGGGFAENAKTKFVTLCIFMLRILFIKTIIFNIMMTFKVWMG